MNGKTRSKLAASALLSFAAATTILSNAWAQGTAFTYQGRLNDGGIPANGNYDLTFTIFDLPTGNGAFAVQTNLGVAVTNGVFTVPLNLGLPGIFTGPDRWLEIAARSNSVGGFSTLTPRQKIAPTPYAITAGNLTGVVPSSGVSGTYSSPVTFNSPANNFTGNGGGLTNVNAAMLNGYSYCNLPCYWNLLGNSGTTPGLDFIGTLDNQPLMFKVNSIGALKVLPGATLPNFIGGIAAFRSPVLDPNVSGVVIAGGSAPSGPFNGIGSGDFMAAFDDDCTIGGGFGNKAGTDNGDTTDAAFATIGGGIFNVSSNFASTVGGGAANVAGGTRAVVAGGNGNMALGNYSFVGGGLANTNGGDYGTIGGGQYNSNLGTNCTISGGSYQRASGMGSTIAGGLDCYVTGYYPTVSGGWANESTSDYAAIGGGSDNSASAPYTTVGGGYLNWSSFQAATIAGGYQNISSNYNSTVGGGVFNVSGGYSATVAGGYQNASSGYVSTIPGGQYNSAAGDFSLAAGFRAKANHKGAFVWADSETADFASSTNDQFCIRARGGVLLSTNTTLNFGNAGTSMLWPDQGGAIELGNSLGSGNTPYLDFHYGTGSSQDFNIRLINNGNQQLSFYRSGSGTPLAVMNTAGLTVNGTFVSASDRNVKENFKAVSPTEILDKVAALPLSRWNYKEDKSQEHIGPMAQDFYAAFAVGPDEKHITTIDESGVALAAIQGLNRKLQVQDTALKTKDREIQELRSALAELQMAVRKLNNKTQE